MGALFWTLEAGGSWQYLQLPPGPDARELQILPAHAWATIETIETTETIETIETIVSQSDGSFFQPDDQRIFNTFQKKSFTIRFVFLKTPFYYYGWRVTQPKMKNAKCRVRNENGASCSSVIGIHFPRCHPTSCMICMGSPYFLSIYIRVFFFLPDPRSLERSVRVGSV